MTKMMNGLKHATDAKEPGVTPVTDVFRMEILHTETGLCYRTCIDDNSVFLSFSLSLSRPAASILIHIFIYGYKFRCMRKYRGALTSRDSAWWMANLIGPSQCYLLLFRIVFCSNGVRKNSESYSLLQR